MDTAVKPGDAAMRQSRKARSLRFNSQSVRGLAKYFQGCVAADQSARMTLAGGCRMITEIFHSPSSRFCAYCVVFISTRMPWIVFPEALKTRPAGCGAMFTTRHP